MQASWGIGGNLLDGGGQAESGEVEVEESAEEPDPKELSQWPT